MINPRVPIYFELPDLRDFLNYLDKQVEYYRSCEKTGCKITETAYRRYLRLRNDVIEAINNRF